MCALVLHAVLLGMRHVAVFGGSGLVGSRVCRALTEEFGATVTSISLSTSTAPEWAANAPWAQRVDWRMANASEPGAAEAVMSSLGSVDGVVSCIGSQDVLDLSTSGREESWRYRTWRLNGPPNVAVARAARREGVQRYVYVGVSSDAETGLSGAMPGLFNGKREAADAARDAFGDDAIVFGPHRIFCEAGVMGALGSFAQSALSSPVGRGLVVANRVLGNIGEWRTCAARPAEQVSPPHPCDIPMRAGCAGYRGEDFVTKTQLTPPVAANDLAIAIAAVVVGAVEVERTERVAMVPSKTGSGVEVRVVGRHVDGTDAILRLTGAALAASASARREQAQRVAEGAAGTTRA